MSAFVAYLLGLATIPAVYLIFAGWIRFSLWLTARLEKRGISMEFRAKRNLENIPNYQLERDIWFESGWLIYRGFWVRDVERYFGDEDRFVTDVVRTTWTGFGNPSGPYFAIYHKTKLATDVKPGQPVSLS